MGDHLGMLRALRPGRPSVRIKMDALTVMRYNGLDRIFCRRRQWIYHLCNHAARARLHVVWNAKNRVERGVSHQSSSQEQEPTATDEEYGAED